MIQKTTARAEAAMTKLRALQALQPDWAYLKNLKEAVLKSTDARQKELEVHVAGKASAAADLHEQRDALDATLQVKACPQKGVHDADFRVWSHFKAGLCDLDWFLA